MNDLAVNIQHFGSLQNIIPNVIAISIAILSLAIAILIGVKQNRNFLMSIVIQKAAQVNSFLSRDKIPEEAGSFSGMVTNIITTKEILDKLEKQHRLAANSRFKVLLKDVFYLQLHTSVREWLKEEPNDDAVSKMFPSKSTIVNQIEKAQLYLSHQQNVLFQLKYF